jgi:hypothetical protein
MNKSKICTLLAGLIFIFIPTLVKAYTLSPTPNYGLISITTADAQNNKTFFNYGRIAISSEGVLTNGYPNAALTMFNFGVMENLGTLNNWGLIRNTYGTLNNIGTLNNASAHLGNAYGTINNTGSIVGGYMSNFFGIVLNSGSISGKTFTNSAGTFDNSGAITSTTYYRQFDGGTHDSFTKTINSGTFKALLIQIVDGSVSGTGSFTGDATISRDASINPGNDQSRGILTFNGAFHSSGDFVFEIAGTASGQYDALAINGAADFTGGNVEFDFIDGFHASVGDHWDFLLANNVTGWDSLSFSFNVSGLGTSITQDSLGAHLSITSVPEPETYAMFMAGLGLMGFIARRRKNNQA